MGSSILDIHTLGSSSYVNGRCLSTSSLVEYNWGLELLHMGYMEQGSL